MGIMEAIVSIVGVVLIFSVPFAFFAFVRYLRYKETMALAERGLLRPERPRRNQDTLRWGIVIAMLGIALICGLWPLGFMSGSDRVEIGVARQGTVGGEDAGIDMPASGFTVGESDVPFGAGPWLVLGILPFFFGLSLIIIHWVNQREGAGAGDEEAIPPHKQMD